jgi:two-component system, NarL family, sensor kinase
LLKLQDDERRDLARELHHTTAQNISALIMNLDMIEMSAGAIAPATRAALCESVALARQSLHEIRTFSYLLHPPMLDEFGLLQAIRIFVDDFSRRSGIQVDLEVPTSFVTIHKDLEVTLFRVLQEGLLNVYRHSNSRAARVEVELDATNIRMKVENQIGGSTAPLSEGDSDKGEVPVTIGVGIAGMRERVGQFGGQLALSRQDDRAILDVTLPICQPS